MKVVFNCSQGDTHATEEEMLRHDAEGVRRQSERLPTMDECCPYCEPSRMANAACIWPGHAASEREVARARAEAFREAVAALRQGLLAVAIETPVSPDTVQVVGHLIEWLESRAREEEAE